MGNHTVEKIGGTSMSRFGEVMNNVIIGSRKGAALYNRVWDLAIRAAIANGGVINEHHGVGLKLGRLMKELYGPAKELVLDKLKKELDPNNIMNPGKIFDLQPYVSGKGKR